MRIKGIVMIESIKDEVEKAIKYEKPIKIKAYALTPNTENGLEYILKEILHKYNKPDYLSPLYTCVKELSLNGIKANIKRILFAEKKINLENEKEYEAGMDIFRKNLSEEWIFEYAKKAKSRNLFIEINFNYNPHRIILEVVNNGPLSKREDERIRSKFKTGIEYDNIAQFYLAVGDNSEGAGMGIVLITMLLKAQGVDPHLFTIRTNYKDSTIAKIEFPFSDDYRTTRDRFDLNKDYTKILY